MLERKFTSFLEDFLTNERQVFKKKGSTYMPVYYCMFLENHAPDNAVILPELEGV